MNSKTQNMVVGNVILASNIEALHRITEEDEDDTATDVADKNPL